MFFQLADIDVTRSFLQEQIQHRLKVLKGVDQDEQSDTDAHKRVYHPDVGKVHDDGTYQNYNPAQHILQHMEVHCLLVDGVTLPGHISCHKVKYDPDDSKDNHSTVVYLHWVQKSSDRSDYDQDRASQQDGCCNDPAQDRVSDVAICVFFISLLFTFLLKKIRDADGECVAQVVEGIGKNGHRVDE